MLKEKFIAFDTYMKNKSKQLSKLPSLKKKKQIKSKQSRKKIIKMRAKSNMLKTVTQQRKWLKPKGFREKTQNTIT